MRIVAGRFGGRRLQAPAGRATRPTSDRVREALFAILGPLDGRARARPVRGLGRPRARGALARGGARRPRRARRRAAAVARANAEPPGARAATRSRCSGCRRAVRSQDARRRGAAYDLVFLDPPYADAPRLGPELSGPWPPSWRRRRAS